MGLFITFSTSVTRINKYTTTDCSLQWFITSSPMPFPTHSLYIKMNNPLKC